MDKPLLQVRNLSICFDEQKAAVQNVNFSINKGEVLALVGESGSGKTLTGLAIMQLLPIPAQLNPNSQILLSELDLSALSEAQLCKIRGRHVGMVFQEASSALNPVFTIGEQIGEVLRQHFHLSNHQRQNRIAELLEESGIAETIRVSQSYPHQLSGGLRQRAMIAMALAGDPDLLIADEPTTAIDVTLQAQILQLLQDLQHQKQMSLLFITHDLAIVENIADRVAVIHQGEIIEQAEKKAFFKHPKQAYSRELFAAQPDWSECLSKEKPTADNQEVCRVENLKVYFPIHTGIFQRPQSYIKAVDDVSFKLLSGRTLALVGESGSGKTTTAHALVGLVKPTAGSIHWQNLQTVPQIIFQDPYSSMDPRMMIGDIVQEGLLAQNMGKNDQNRQRMVHDILRRVGLDPEIENRYPHEFSGGQRQRICIARALIMKPQLIICDEPTSALDVIVQMQILELLRELQQEYHLSYLLITHNFNVVAYLAHEVAVMHCGRIVEQAGVADVLFHPQQEYTKELIAAVPRLK